MEEIDRPLGIVEVWWETEPGKARVMLSIIRRVGKAWWEFPGGRSVSTDNGVEFDPDLEALQEIFEETGLTIPDTAERINIPLIPYFTKGDFTVADSQKKRIINSIPMLYRYAVKELPEIKLNAQGNIEADDFRWIDVTSLYGSEFRDIYMLLNVIKNQTTTNLSIDPVNPKINLLKVNLETDNVEQFTFSDITRKALGLYAFWVMGNVPTQAEFCGLTVE